MAIAYQCAEEIVGLIKNHDRVFIHGGAATPVALVNALLGRADELRDVELVSISTYGDIKWKQHLREDNFYLNSLFVSANIREWVNGKQGAYTPIFLSEIPALFTRNILQLDVAIIQVSPPDKHGYCTLGPSVDIALSALKCARAVIAQINTQMPRIIGDGVIHLSELTAVIWEPASLPQISFKAASDVLSEQISYHVAGLIEDGATLQMGIGSVPDAVLRQLTSHKGLGIHTEMFSDGLVPLVEQGVITNEHKKILPGKIVSSFILGTQKVYDFADNNPSVYCMDVSFVNDSDIIRRNPKVVAINSAIEIDLTGQVCADSIGTYQYSGIGGQMDFMRGAALSEGGKPIIAMPSVTSKGVSRIVPYLKEGAGVVTTRGHVHYVVTEYGVVNLYGKSLEQRARLLIGLAHPGQRDNLERAYFDRFGKRFSPLIAGNNH